MVGGSWKKHISVKGERAVEEIHQCERREDHGRNIRVKSGGGCGRNTSVWKVGGLEETLQCVRWKGCERNTCERWKGCGRMVRGVWKKHQY